MAFSEEIRQTVETVASTVGPAIVRIGTGAGRGAGVVIAEGQILTNAHNLRGAETTVSFADGRVTTGTVSGVDADGDLAVLSADTGGAAAPTWAPSGSARLGAVVLAVAVTSTGGTRVTLGTVSAVGRRFRGPGGRLITGGIEHTAPLARGSSGGALVDAEGQLLALNTHRIGEGFYLALPTDDDLRARVDRLASGESRERVRLGVSVAPPEVARRLRSAVGLERRDGILVRGVEDASPADRAGLRPGDLIVAAGGSPLISLDELHAALDAAAVGGRLALQVLRGAEELTVEVELGEQAPDGETE